jgi:hypothetical protein
MATIVVGTSENPMPSAVSSAPVAGRMVFEHAVFNPQESPEQRLILYSPVPGEDDTPAKLDELLAP